MIAIVGLGANLGDRTATIRAAAVALAAMPGVVQSALSSLYETVPVGGPPQDDFLNAAMLLRIEPARSPRSLVSALLSIEHQLGRIRGERFGPRTIDLDLLWTDGPPSTHADAVVPHPRLHERVFALAPLVELSPDATTPDGTPYAELLGRLDRGGVRRFTP